jgi:hypothetical protein
VASHLLGFSEALDCLMVTASHQPDRLDIERILASALAREIEACPQELLAKYQRHAAACARGVASVRRTDCHPPQTAR